MKKITNIESTFKNKALFLQALTHRSWVNENDKKRGTNERLEFLGDAILEFIVSKKLYSKFPDKEESYLTALRANLVNTKNLYDVAEKIGLGEKIFLSKGEEDGGGRNNPSLLADTVEAIIGALFIDSGLTKAEEFIKENILVDLDKRAKAPLKDPKSLLQEVIQAQKLPAPKYSVIDEIGPDHDKKFTVEVIIDDNRRAKGEGRSKSEAEQMAAKHALSSYCEIELDNIK